MKKAFTIIEMLVVVAIISTLAGLVLFNVRESRLKARDTTRIHDLAQIQTALEAYKLANGSYPKTANLGAPGFWRASCPTGISFTRNNQTVVCTGPVNWINLLTGISQPKDPINSNGSTCNITTNPCFVYVYGSDGLNYKLMAWNMESSSGKKMAQNDQGSTAMAGSDFCQASYYTTSNQFMCGTAVCNRNTNGVNLNYELYSPGGRCW